MREFRICAECTFPHFENCSRCFGYGLELIDGKLYPVEAYQVMGGELLVKIPMTCPTCKSTYKGVPQK